MITSSHPTPEALNIASVGVVIVTLVGIPIRFITFLPIESPISQMSLENISREQGITERVVFSA